MPTPESSLSVAIQRLADFLSDRFVEDVIVTVDAPQKAQEQAKGVSTHILNIFVYRIAPSGFQTGAGNEEAAFIRAYVLITAFPAGQGSPPPDSDLRVLGQAIRILHSFPVIPETLPGPAPATVPEDFRHGPVTEYQLQVVIQAPTMEEMNHIWTTQGGDLAYRLSVSYELALIPIEPLSHAAASPPVTAGELVVGVANGPRFFQMFQVGARLFPDLAVPAATATVRVNLTGEPQSRVAVTVEWQRADGEINRQEAQVFEVGSADTNDEGAGIDVVLDAPAAGDRASLITVPVDPEDIPVSGASPANVIQLNVEV